MRSALLMSILAAASMQAATINFSCLTDNGNNCAGMVSQLTADITDPGGGEVTFTFNNAGPIASVIAEIYWDDYDTSPLLAAFAVPTFDGTGTVSFSTGANPPNLPSGGNALPPFDDDFAVQANNPAPQNGVGPTESLSVNFTLTGGTTFQNVLDALESGDLRIGMHVTGIGTPGGSDAVLNEPLLPEQQPVPEPSAYALMGAGLIALGSLRKRVRK